MYMYFVVIFKFVLCYILGVLNCAIISFLFSMADGRLLKPTRPAMSLDSTFLQRALGSGGPDGELWVAYTEVCVCALNCTDYAIIKFIH